MVKGEGGIYLFYGNEDFLKKEASKKMVSKLLPAGSRRLNCDILNAKDDYKVIFDTLNTSSLLSDRKIVIIKDIEYLPEPQRPSFLTYLKRLPKDICLILQSNQATLSDKFLKTISHYTKVFLFNKPKEREVRDWIYKRLNQHRKTITKEALSLLLELKGSGDLAVLAGELEKLVTYKGGDKTISEEDVIRLVGKSVTKRVFDLIDALGFKNKDSALLFAHELFSGNKNQIPEVIGLIGWQLRRVWKAKLLLAKGKDRYRVCRELNVRDFLIDKFLNQVSHFNVDELKRGFRLLVEADRRIKSGRQSPEFILEHLIIRLCGT